MTFFVVLFVISNVYSLFVRFFVLLFSMALRKILFLLLPFVPFTPTPGIGLSLFICTVFFLCERYVIFVCIDCRLSEDGYFFFCFFFVIFPELRGVLRGKCPKVKSWDEPKTLVFSHQKKARRKKKGEKNGTFVGAREFTIDRYVLCNVVCYFLQTPFPTHLVVPSAYGHFFSCLASPSMSTTFYFFSL